MNPQQSPCQFTLCFYFLFHSIILFPFFLFFNHTKFNRRLQLSRQEISAKCTCKLSLHQDGVGRENLNFEYACFSHFSYCRASWEPCSFLNNWFFTRLECGKNNFKTFRSLTLAVISPFNPFPPPPPAAQYCYTLMGWFRSRVKRNIKAVVYLTSWETTTHAVSPTVQLNLL